VTERTRHERRRQAAAVRQLLRNRSWVAVGLTQQINAEAARKARREAMVVVPLIVLVLVVYSYRVELFGIDLPIRVGTVVALLALGWTVARDLGRAAEPALFKRLETGTAGTVSFLIRLAMIGVALLIAANIAGLQPGTLAVGGALTVVIFGLAAQQTLANVLAGTVLLSARPFRVGDRVRFQGGPLAGQVEGVVASLGLLYTTLASGEDAIMVPNSVVLSLAVMPLREPAGVDLRARLHASVRPSELQKLLDDTVGTPTRAHPHISLEEVDGDEVVMRVSATPMRDSEGPELADEILNALSEVGSRNGDTPVRVERASPRPTAEPDEEDRP
jgi:small-conductance mechanosensitive channel